MSVPRVAPFLQGTHRSVVGWGERDPPLTARARYLDPRRTSHALYRGRSNRLCLVTVACKYEDSEAAVILRPAAALLSPGYRATGSSGFSNLPRVVQDWILAVLPTGATTSSSVVPHCLRDQKTRGALALFDGLPCCSLWPSQFRSRRFAPSREPQVDLGCGGCSAD